MAFTANTAFEARLTNNENDILSHVAGKYQASGVDADCNAGHLVKAISRLAVEGFTGLYNENTWLMNDAIATDTFDTPIYACDTYDNMLATVKGNNYFVGTETLGLGVPAGRYGNFTRINFDGQSIYRFGVGNFSTTVGANEYATIANGQLVPAASAPSTAGTPYFKIVGTGNFVEGHTDSFAYYDVIACRISA